MNRDKQPLHEEIIYVQGERNNVQVEVSLQWCTDAYTDNVLGFANNIRTIDGGTHLEGLKAVLTRTLNATARKRNKIKENESNLSGEHVREEVLLGARSERGEDLIAHRVGVHRGTPVLDRA